MSVTELITAIEAGDEEAKDRLFSSVYEELRQMAKREMRRERSDHTLQPRGLVHEAYTKLVLGRVLDEPRSREYLFAAAAKAMRQILTDYARYRDAQKRGGGWVRVRLDEASILPDASDPVEGIALHKALDELKALNERYHTLAVLRSIGLTHKEIAKQLNISVATSEKDWRSAKAWLRDQLSSEEPTGTGPL